MEFRDLKKQYEILKPDIDTAIMSVIGKTNFISGSEVNELEQALAKYVGVKHCITCANGTDALTVSLKAMGITKGDAVFVPDFTFFATAEAVAQVGATPIFVDVELSTYNMDCEDLENAIIKVNKEGKYRPKAIIPVDLFGQPADYDRIQGIAAQYHLFVLEDGAQGFGGMIGARKVCSFGNVAATSFFPAKPLGCYGDGGAIFTDDDELAQVIRSICIHGKGEYKYDNVRIGMNSRLDTIQAAILLVKLKQFQTFELEEINNIATYYTEHLQDYVVTPTIRKGCQSSWAQYVIQLSSKEERDLLAEELKKEGIPTAIYYPKPLHEQSAFKDKTELYSELKCATRLSETVLALPIHPYLEKAEQNKVINTIQMFLNKKI